MHNIDFKGKLHKDIEVAASDATNDLLVLLGKLAEHEPDRAFNIYFLTIMTPLFVGLQAIPTEKWATHEAMLIIEFMRAQKQLSVEMKKAVKK